MRPALLLSALPSALLLLASCAAPLARHAYARAAMGTEFRLVFYADDPERADAAAEAAFARIAALERALSDYDPASELTRLGQASDAAVPSAWIPLSNELGQVLREGQRIARASGGAFDVTVGPLTRLWRRARRQQELPAADDLAQALAAVGYARLELDASARHARLHARGMRLDLGGIAKGQALDQALDVLSAHGFARALVDGGGDVAVRAAPPGRPGWSVAVVGLDGERTQELLLVEEALATSGDLERYVELAGIRYSHILDPRTGRALRERRLASVRAASGMEADAWATALSVLGAEGLERLAREHGPRARLLVAGPAGPELFESEGFASAISSRPTPSPPAPRRP